MNTRQIQPVSIWTPTGLKNATYFALTDFFGYHFDNGIGKVTYKLIGMEPGGTTTLEDGTVIQNPDSAVDYVTDNLEVPGSIIQQWGADDEIIFEYVATSLGLAII